MKIDLEKLICSLMSDDSYFINGFYKNLLKKVLKEQGIEYKDGKLVQIENQQEFDKINTSNHLCHHSEESADHQEKVFVYHTPQTSLPLSKEVHYMLVDKDLSSLLKQLCKEASSLQGHELHSYLSYLAGVFEGSARQRQQKIEQKPAWSEMGANGNEKEIPFSVWSEEDEQYYNMLSRIVNSIDTGGQGDKTLQYWFACLKDKIIPQPKQEWSEEDEEFMKATFLFIESYAHEVFYGVSKVDVLNWLKSLRPQSQIEWNEDDENRFKNLIFLIEHSDEGEATKKGFVDFINRLKSIISSPKKDVMNEDEFEHIVGYLVQDIVANEHMPEGERQSTKFFVEKYYNKLRPQPTWKPSEEQMEALKGVQDGVFRLSILQSLYDDLKKLKG